MSSGVNFTHKTILFLIARTRKDELEEGGSKKERKEVLSNEALSLYVRRVEEYSDTVPAYGKHS